MNIVFISICAIFVTSYGSLEQSHVDVPPAENGQGLPTLDEFAIFVQLLRFVAAFHQATQLEITSLMLHEVGLRSP